MVKERTYRLTCGCLKRHRGILPLPVNTTTLCAEHLAQGVVEEVTEDSEPEPA